jgi:Zn-dependent metalloprotease
MTRPVAQIVPPYLLAQLANSEDALADAARQTLVADQRRRTARQTMLPPSAATKRATSAALDRAIHDAGHTENLPGRLVRAESADATGDAAVDEAYDGLGATWKLYRQVYRRNSIDDAGMELIGTVHYGERYQNAFWNGDQMVFGDGDGQIFGRFTASLDVIGHELTHGVTEHTAGLVYSGQPGALNESVSDVFGILVKQYALGQDAAASDWLIGADLLMPGVKGVALRNMLHPGTAYDDPRLGKDPQPADMTGYVKTRSDNGGVHYNSGIPNRAFALAATVIGGKVWDSVGRVWYDVLTGSEITADCDFATFARLTAAAADTRFGADSAQARAVRDAWATVGVTSGSAPAGTETPPPVGKNSSLLLRRTGGFAGLTSERSTTLAELPKPDRRAWQGLLAEDTLPRLAADSRPRPDAFTYCVTCHDANVDVEVAEPDLPSPVRALFERTLLG